MNDIGLIYCPQCRRKWQEFDPAGACPYCSAEVARTFVADVIEPESGRVCADVACITCGYNVRTQPVLGRCPECGTAIPESLVRGRLIFMPIDWLRRVSRGIRGTFAALVMAAIGVLLMLTTTFFPFAGMFAVASEAVYIGTVLLFVIGTPLVWIFAAWRATTPDPLNAPEWKPLRWRLVMTRWLMLAAAGMFAFLILIIIASLLSHDIPFGGFAEIMVCMGFGIPLTFLLSVLLYATILRAYLVRQIREGLRRMLRAWAWLIGVTILLFMMMMVIQWGLSTGEFLYFSILQFVTIFNGVLQLVALGVGLYCTFETWRHFRAIIRTSRTLTIS